MASEEGGQLDGLDLQWAKHWAFMRGMLVGMAAGIITGAIIGFKLFQMAAQ